MKIIWTNTEEVSKLSEASFRSSLYHQMWIYFCTNTYKRYYLIDVQLKSMQSIEA